MRRVVHLRPSPAMAVAFIALLVALGGGAYAASVFPANSVGSKQLKRGAVTTPKLRNNAVTGAKVKESSLSQVPFAGHANSAGALDKVTYRSAAGSAGAGGQIGGATATCDPGSHPTGGGVKVDDPQNEFVIDTYPEGNTGWSARVANFAASALGFHVFAVCAAAGTTG